jgi:hypothetical protein
MRALTKATLLTVLLSFLALGQQGVDTRSLSGLIAVTILIERLGPDIEREGLSRELLKNDIELRLRLAGIRVVDDPFEDLGGRPVVPYPNEVFGPDTLATFRGRVGSMIVQSSLSDEEKSKFIRILTDVTLGTRRQIAQLRVFLHTLKAEESFYIFNVKLQVAQGATLERDYTLYHPGAITWIREDLGYVGKRNNQPLAAYMRQVVQDLVDQFINQYLSVNPLSIVR